jgi:uracil-DNA glycosylase family 4
MLMGSPNWADPIRIFLLAVGPDFLEGNNCQCAAVSLRRDVSYPARMADSPAPLLEPMPTLRQILAFYLESGVDCALEENPVDRLTPSASAELSAIVPALEQDVPQTSDVRKVIAPRQPATLRETMPAVPPEIAAAAARDAACSAPSLEALRNLMETFEGCALRNTATRLVFADGNPEARVMFVGEAPGRDEDIEGLPFVGRSGKLLDLMLAAIGLDRSTAYIANVIPWRPPGNRDPSPQETHICLPFIRRHIELVNPDVLVCLGQSSSRTILGLTEGITKMRGRWRDYDTGKRTIQAMATFHPAYLLRQPSHKRFAYLDLRAIAKALQPIDAVA